MDGVKGFFSSKGVWGGIIAVVAAGAGLIGYVVTPDDTLALKDHVTEIAAAVGGIIAIYGRVTATKRIG